MRGSAIRSIGGYREDLKNAEDLDLWFRLASLGHKMHNTQRYLVNYRVHGSNSIIRERNLMIANTFKLLKENRIWRNLKLNRGAIRFAFSSILKYSLVLNKHRERTRSWWMLKHEKR